MDEVTRVKCNACLNENKGMCATKKCKVGINKKRL